MKNLFLLFAFSLFLFSCSNPDGQVATEDIEDVDSVANVETEEDVTAMQNPIDSNAVEEKVETIIPPKETKVLNKATFCDCIKRQKKIDDDLEDANTDQEIDKVLKAMDELQEGECKELLNDGQTSPDQRAERKRKIAKCLGS